MNQSINYKIKSSQTSTNIILGISIITLSLVTFVLLGRFISLPIGILLIVIGFIEKDKEIIRLHENHLEIKAALAAPLLLIKYSDISEINVINNKKALMKVEGNPKMVRLPLNRLTENDSQEFIKILKEKITPPFTTD